jgi:hypothetical protein
MVRKWAIIDQRGLEGRYPMSEMYFKIPRRNEKEGALLDSDSEMPAKKMSGNCRDSEYGASGSGGSGSE